MYQLLAYFLFNFLGFFAFYFIWLKLKKPEPYDYTTICGLKCKDLQLNKASIVLSPAVPINKLSKSRGNLNEIQEFGTVNAFLQWFHNLYGPLTAFHWGSRYTISVGSLKLVNSLKKYKDLLLPFNPLLYSSILVGDPNAWQKSTNLNENKEFNDEISTEQANLFVSYDPNTDYSNGKSVNPCKWVKGPLALVFDCEIEIDAHPVPANIPILISVPLLLDEKSQSSDVHSEFKWIFDRCFNK